jgi:hypothetical protein
MSRRHTACERVALAVTAHLTLTSSAFPPPTRMHRLIALIVFLVLCHAPIVEAQDLTRPRREWRTVETAHFVIHYTVALERWALDMAERIESVREEVTAFVSYEPRRKVTVLVDDPLNTPNGFALAFLDSPVIYLFPTPPAPTWSIGSYREWSELLSVHEFAHIAHLTRPSRNPWERRLVLLLPFRIGPIARRAPQWAVEGYATLVEGRLTGSGRPHGVWRPALLRQWAIEGRLPRYDQLGASADFRGGEIPYLVGSAYLEWLAERHGDSSLVHLWRRLSARQSRSFAGAFTGVFGAPPDELYGRFMAELTADAVGVERSGAIRDGREGELVQRIAGETGAPSLSPDGAHLALVFDPPGRPSRLVIMETAEDTALARRIKESRERLARRDPEDVPDVIREPLPRRVVATLHPSGGRGHAEPRFFADGERVLVVRYESLPGGGRRRDLFVWSYRRGGMKRITRGAGIMRADPSPDGRTAAAEQCVRGWCDLVLVDLGSGAIRSLRTGSPAVSYYRPRFSPDGSSIVVSEHAASGWRLLVVPAGGGEARVLEDPSGASRYDATFLRDGSGIVYIAERGGVPNVERLLFAGAVSARLTNTTGAALAPEPAPDGSVYYLRLQSRGMYLARVGADPLPGGATWPTLERSAVVARAPAARDSFARASLPSARDYGLGPRGFRLLPGTQTATNGQGVILSLGNFDPVGRLTLLVQGAAGTAPAWRGGAVRAVYRRHAIAWRGELFVAGDRPSRQRWREIAPQGLDADYWGGLLMAEWERSLGDRETSVRLGGSAARIDPPRGDDARRILSMLELRHARLQTRGTLHSTQSVLVHGAVGRTGDASWERVRASATVALGILARGIRADIDYARTGSDAPPLEQPVIGGAGALLFDQALLSQRIPMPVLPLGIAGGRQALSYRGALTAGLVEAYYWAGAGGRTLREWQRVVGIETREFRVAIPFARVPELQLTTGVGYTLDEPFRHRLRGYGSLSIRP